jgi:dihydroflavonol-4-reductase
MMTVCVTGASGFLGSWIVERLLTGGARVVATVRGTTADAPHLTALPGAADRLEIATADLRDEGAYDDIVAGCDAMIHAAGPYTLDVKNPQRDLIDPTVGGVRNVLRACTRSERVRRVVFTSSMATITDEPPDRDLTEKDWNERSSLRRNPYYYANTLAERAAWDFMEREAAARFDLVVINPMLVIGPSMVAPLNTTSRVFAELLQGNYPGMMDFAWGMVDVRDVAEAHVRALEVESASGRYLCAAHTLTMQELVRFLDEHGWDASSKIKLDLTGWLGRRVVWLASWFRGPGTGGYLRSHTGRMPRFDNGKIRRDLGIEFRPLEESMLDTLESLVRWGHVPAARVAD